MHTATLDRPVEQFIDPLGRTCCRNGHEWTAENKRVGPTGTWHCRICGRASEKRGEERRRLGHAPRQRHAPCPRVYSIPPQTEAAEPVSVPWWRYELPAWYRERVHGRAVVKMAVRAFFCTRVALPEVVLVHPENVCQMGEVTVRESNGRTEPEPTRTEVYLR